MTGVPYKVALALGAGLFGASVIGGAGYSVVANKRFPGFPPGTLDEFHRHLIGGQLRLAAREHRIASTIDPTSHANSPELAEAMRRAGDAEGEIDQYRRARDRWRRDPATHRALGLALCHYGRFEEGLAALKEALRLDPGSAATHLALANVWLDRDNLVDAVRAFREAVRLDPANAEAHNGLGIALAVSGDHRQALQAFEQAVRLRPDPAYRLNLEKEQAVVIVGGAR